MAKFLASILSFGLEVTMLKIRAIHQWTSNERKKFCLLNDIILQPMHGVLIRKYFGILFTLQKYETVE